MTLTVLLHTHSLNLRKNQACTHPELPANAVPVRSYKEVVYSSVLLLTPDCCYSPGQRVVETLVPGILVHLYCLHYGVLTRCGTLS